MIMEMSDTNQPRRRKQIGSSVGSLIMAAGAAYGAYRLVSWAWDAWKGGKEDKDDHVGRAVLVSDTPSSKNNYSTSERQRWRLRRQRMQRCRDEAVNALSDFLPTLRKKLEDLTDTSADTKELKQLRNSDESASRREKERELWNNIKTQALTRLVATSYAHSILFLVLTVQVHLMGGKLFEEQAQAAAESSCSMGQSIASGRVSSYQESHRVVLTKTYQFFFDEGIPLLVQAVERAVETVVGDWDVTHPSSVHTSREMLDQAIQDICKNVEGRCTTGRSRRPRSMMRFLLPPEQGLDSVVADDLAQAILDETLDILESPVFEDAQRDCLSTTFAIMRDKSWANIFVETNLPQHAATPWGTKPLATVVSKLKKTSMTFYQTQKSGIEGNLVLVPSKSSFNLYLSTIERIPTVLELGDISFN